MAGFSPEPGEEAPMRGVVYGLLFCLALYVVAGSVVYLVLELS